MGPATLSPVRILMAKKAKGGKKKKTTTKKKGKGGTGMC